MGVDQPMPSAWPHVVVACFRFSASACRFNDRAAAGPTIKPAAPSSFKLCSKVGPAAPHAAVSEGAIERVMAPQVMELQVRADEECAWVHVSMHVYAGIQLRINEGKYGRMNGSGMDG